MNSPVWARRLAVRAGVSAETAIIAALRAFRWSVVMVLFRSRRFIWSI